LTHSVATHLEMTDVELVFVFKSRFRYYQKTEALPGFSASQPTFTVVRSSGCGFRSASGR